jgi:hypothetical protein
MGLLDFMRRRTTRLREPGELADFIDQNAAFLVQKGIYEYARARAGHYAKVLFAEADFKEAVERSRWQAYPLGLAMIAEMVEGILRPHFEQRRAGLDPLIALTLSVFDRYPVPSVLGAAAWSDLRNELARQLNLIGIHDVKPAKDIPIPFAKRYFDLLPIHEKLRTAESLTITNYLRVTACNIHDQLTQRADVAALAQALRG